MALTSAMEDVFYDKKHFNVDRKFYRHPDYVTEKHFLYHLAVDKNSRMNYRLDGNGIKIKSPR